MSFDYRLKKEKDFNLVFRNGKRAYSDSLSAVFIPSEDIKADTVKAGFAVGKKHGGSVERNRIKRLLRESFRSFVPEISKNFCFVFIPKVKEEYTLDKFKKDMGYILKKNGFIIKKC